MFQKSIQKIHNLKAFLFNERFKNVIDITKLD